MKQRGKRIRPSGKDLVFHFTIASLLPVFLLVVGLFHVKTIQQINWQDFNLSQADKIDIPYLIISFSVAILICLLVAFVFKRVRYDTVKQLYHRQKLAKMILENKWYESEQVKTEGFFKDSAGRTKEKITYFPKMYYRLKNGLIQILCNHVLFLIKNWRFLYKYALTCYYLSDYLKGVNKYAARYS